MKIVVVVVGAVKLWISLIYPENTRKIELGQLCGKRKYTDWCYPQNSQSKDPPSDYPQSVQRKCTEGCGYIQMLENRILGYRSLISFSS